VLRKALFGIYGGTIGAVYVLLIDCVLPVHPAMRGVGLLIAVIPMAWFAVQIGTRSKGHKTDIGRCVTVAILPLLFAGFVFVCVALVMVRPILLPMAFIKGWRQAGRFRRKMEEQGRFARAKALEPKLAAAEH
jgi:hypothetical protein